MRSDGRPGGVVAASHPVEGRKTVEAVRLHALEHVLFPHPGTVGDLGRCRRPAELLAQGRDRAIELEVQFLDAPRYSNRPAAVAESGA